MFRKATNMTLVVIIALFLCGTLGLKVASGLGAPLPEWMAVGQKHSYLEGRDYEKRPNLTIESISSGVFQFKLDKYLSDIIPLKDSVTLANAAMQRASIKTANAFFSFSCYPTYYGSSKVFVSEHNAIMYMPVSLNRDELTFACESLSNLSLLAKDYPDVLFSVYVVQGGQFASANPAYDYCSNATNGDEYAKALLDSIDEDVGNIFLFTKTYSSVSDFLTEFFRTDHHWNSQGAITAFNDMAEEMGITSLSNPKRTDFGDYRFSGAIARWGLDLQTEEVFDLGGDGEGLTVIEPDGKTIPYSHDRWSKDVSTARIYRFHDEYYDWLKDGSTIVNMHGEGRALIVCDSYGADLVPMLGRHFASLDYVKDLHSSSKSTGSLRALLEEGNYDCVFLIASCSNYSKLALRSPDYFL
ncbi:MAG: hypothetical protein IKF56_07505 [Eggerthellaceae bacterium]|nr:hypothetical protein [Eggerthellaceae bacterium]